MVPLTFIFQPGNAGVRAVVIGRRQVQSAVRRNRIRRRIRELLRLHPAWFAGSLNLVIRAGEGSDRLGFRKLEELLEQAGKRIGREDRRDE
jgi:ribonuclease P protein component